MLHQRLGDRVAKLETSFTSLSDDVQGLEASVGDLGGKIDKLVEGLSATGERATARANAVRDELSDAADRKARERSDLLKNATAMLGAIVVVVSALTGPWKEKLSTTATGQIADTAAIAGVREVLAQQGASIGRNTEAIATAREVNRSREDRVYDLDHRLARLEGQLGAH